MSSPVKSQLLEIGSPFPLGVTLDDSGVNFSVYSKGASRVDLLLFEDPETNTPSATIPMDVSKHRTYHYWHVRVPNLRNGQIYGYRADGPYDPGHGSRFNPRKTLLDPYGRAVAIPRGYDRNRTDSPAMKSVIATLDNYDWEGDQPLRLSSRSTVIYEMHVKGFTRHPSSGVESAKAGTYAGVIEKIPYLVDLGITAVELMPIFQFDGTDAPGDRTNYWGYSPISFFAPHCAYSSGQDPIGALDEFRDMVKALHRAGIEVYLDVVFNHTAEGNENGPTFCYRGLANRDYYIIDPSNGSYVNYSGTGNTLNAHNAIVRRLILDSLRYWVTEMHVDGFRFDLASVLTRDEIGRPLANPPIIWDIESEPALAGTKLIAEAWDAAGLYQVGSFVGDSWKEWNGRFRDDVRRFMKGDRATVSALASRILGSPDIYGHEEREAEQSINFVTCHDGFTLNDLVSYNSKHNEENGEQNNDGMNENLSWNCGAEGPTIDGAVESLRNKQIKNFITINLLAVGIPMVLMGDEVRRTQRGNNNAYCQDSEISWLDWSLQEQHLDIYRFTKLMIAFRKRRDLISEQAQLSLNQILSRARLDWHGVNLGQPDWGEESHSLAFTLVSLRGSFSLHAMFNAYWEPLTFRLPAPIEGSVGWYRWVDTSQASPDDIHEWDRVGLLGESHCVVEPRSVVLAIDRCFTEGRGLDSHAVSHYEQTQ